jgi:pimeloyl-ACP methyl ester carboxylesterase
MNHFLKLFLFIALGLVVVGCNDTSTTTTPETPGDTGEKPVANTCGVTTYEFPEELYPFTDRCLDLGYGDYHYFDEQSSDTPKGTVLMVHGNPTSSFLYRNIAASLKDQGYRVIAMDHYGFGESAKPDASLFSYLPHDHLQVLVDFVDALELNDVTLVVQDWGGPLGLGMAVQRPDIIKNILVMNTFAWQVTPADASGVFGDIVRWSQYNQQQSDTIIKTAQLPRTTGDTLSALYDEPIATQVKEAYYGPFIDLTTGLPYSETVALPTNLFAKSILEDTEMFEILGNLEPLTNKPVYFYYGQLDPFFGALTPNPDGSCALGTSTIIEGRTYCTEEGELLYPVVDRFVETWNAEKITGIEFNATAEHFIQEYAPERIVEIVVELSSKE